MPAKKTRQKTRTTRTDRPTLQPNGRRMGRPPIRTTNISRSWFLALRDWGCSLAMSAADSGVSMHEGRRLDQARRDADYLATPLPPGFVTGLIPKMPARRRASLVRKVLARRLWRQKRENALADAIGRSFQSTEVTLDDIRKCAAYWFSRGIGLDEDDEFSSSVMSSRGLAATPARAQLARRWVQAGRPCPPAPEVIETVDEAVAYVVEMINQGRRARGIRQTADSKSAV